MFVVIEQAKNRLHMPINIYIEFELLRYNLNENYNGVTKTNDKDENEKETYKVVESESVFLFGVHSELLWGLSTEYEEPEPKISRTDCFGLKSKVRSQSLPPSFHCLIENLFFSSLPGCSIYLAMLVGKFRRQSYLSEGHSSSAFFDFLV